MVGLTRKSHGTRKKLPKSEPQLAFEGLKLKGSVCGAFRCVDMFRWLVFRMWNHSLLHRVGSTTPLSETDLHHNDWLFLPPR